MQDERGIPHQLLILIALLQGGALLFLHQAIELKFWPAAQPQWLFAFYSIAIAGPVMLMLGLTEGKVWMFAKYLVPFILLLGVLGFYVGYQAVPLPHIKFETLLFAFVLTLSIAVFKALMYTQQFVSGENFSYSNLFLWLWRNFLTLALSLLFALCVWGVLMLWAFLFKAIKINLFYDLFTEAWFYYPAITLAHGFGVLIFRRLSHVIDVITRLQQALMKFLLVLLVFVSVLFLGGLLFTGLQPLWGSGGSYLILWMQALMLFFLNAVYQDDVRARPYHVWIHRFIYMGVALLPIYSVVSYYGLSLRIEQYGWSVSRCWGFLIWALLAMFSLGYLWGIARYRDNWLQQLSRVNVSMGLVVLAMMLLVCTPLLDFRKISVSSQLQRLETGQVMLEDFDVRYFRNQLARPGYLALEDLKERYAESHPEIVLKINNYYRDYGQQQSISKEEFLAAINLMSGEIPASLAEQLFKDFGNKTWATEDIKKYYLMPVDMNGDAQLEYLYVENYIHYRNIKLYYQVGEEWLAQAFGSDYSKLTDEDFIRLLSAGEYKVVAPEWSDIEIGGTRLRAQ
jgi:hypothetical protein